MKKNWRPNKDSFKVSDESFQNSFLNASKSMTAFDFGNVIAFQTYLFSFKQNQSI